jgi:hypothetical protein
MHTFFRSKFHKYFPKLHPHTPNMYNPRHSYTLSDWLVVTRRHQMILLLGGDALCSLIEAQTSYLIANGRPYSGISGNQLRDRGWSCVLLCILGPLATSKTSASHRARGSKLVAPGLGVCIPTFLSPSEVNTDGKRSIKTTHLSELPK